MRQTAVQNLGRLSGMSVRIDALATELLTQSKGASGDLKEPYLVAFKGLLSSSGSRLKPETLAIAGETLQELLQKTGVLVTSYDSKLKSLTFHPYRIQLKDMTEQAC